MGVKRASGFNRDPHLGQNLFRFADEPGEASARRPEDRPDREVSVAASQTTTADTTSKTIRIMKMTSNS